jgi:hypothetical protein
MLRIDQWLPAAHRGDALGDEAVRIREVLRRSGRDSEIYALDIDEEAEGDVLPFSERRESDLVLFHFARPSPLTPAFARSNAKRVLIYHNITPPEFFADTTTSWCGLRPTGRELNSAGLRSGAERFGVQPKGARAFGFAPASFRSSSTSLSE